MKLTRVTHSFTATALMLIATNVSAGGFVTEIDSNQGVVINVNNDESPTAPANGDESFAVIIGNNYIDGDGPSALATFEVLYNKVDVNTRLVVDGATTLNSTLGVTGSTTLSGGQPLIIRLV